MTPTPFERETIVNSTDGDTVVRIYTERRRDLRRLRADARFTLAREGVHSDGQRWAEFTIPAREWNPVSGAKRRSGMTPDQRARAAAQLRELRRRVSE